MKHLTTLITTLLLSLITTQMSADTGGTYQLVPKDYTFQEGDIIIIASYDENNKIVAMKENFGFYNVTSANDAYTNSDGVVIMPNIIKTNPDNPLEAPIELYTKTVDTENCIITLKKKDINEYASVEASTSIIWRNTTKTHNNWAYHYTDDAYNFTNGTMLKNVSFSRFISTNGTKFAAYQIAQLSSYNFSCCYKKINTVPYTISSYGYSTLYYSDKSLILPEGVKAYTYTIDNGNLKVLETFNGSSEEESNRIVPRGAAVMVKGASGEYELVETTTEAYNNSNNVLAGTDTESETTGGSKYYMLSVGKIGLGLYWGADDGGVFTNGEHKAYLRIPAGSSAKALHFSLPDDDMPTAITTSSATKPALATPSYNLQGINASTTHSGIVISNGKKLIRK